MSAIANTPLPNIPASKMSILDDTYPNPFSVHLVYAFLSKTEDEQKDRDNMWTRCESDNDQKRVEHGMQMPFQKVHIAPRCNTDLGRAFKKWVDFVCRTLQRRVSQITWKTQKFHSPQSGGHFACTTARRICIVRILWFIYFTTIHLIMVSKYNIKY